MCDFSVITSTGLFRPLLMDGDVLCGVARIFCADIREEFVPIEHYLVIISLILLHLENNYSVPSVSTCALYASPLQPV
jgi:hypothetical protein